FDAVRDTLNPLLGQSPDPEMVAAVERAVLAHPEVQGIHDLIIHDYGPGRGMMSLHAEVPMDCDVLATHDAIDNIERELRRTFRCTEVVIHMDPIATHDERVNDVRRRIANLIRAIDENMTIHDFRMTCGPHHTNLIFDVVVPHRFRLSDERVKAAIDQAVRAMDPTYFTVVEVDHAYAETPGTHHS
ncbi:MAG: cation transporter dimerization domain-containing protein, partial [Oscillospiraceae bacterium]